MLDSGCGIERDRTPLGRRDFLGSCPSPLGWAEGCRAVGPSHGINGGVFTLTQHEKRGTNPSPSESNQIRVKQTRSMGGAYLCLAPTPTSINRGWRKRCRRCALPADDRPQPVQIRGGCAELRGNLRVLPRSRRAGDRRALPGRRRCQVRRHSRCGSGNWCQILNCGLLRGGGVWLNKCP